MSEQNQETKEASDSPSSSGWFEEAPDPIVETDEKMIVSEEGEVQDFVEALNTPTEEQNPTDKVEQKQEGIIGQDFFDKNNEWSATVLGELPTGEHLQVMKRAEHGYYLAYREGLKSVPREIQGWWTNYDKAEQAGRVYLNQLWDQDATATSS